MHDILSHIADALQVTGSGQIIFNDRPLLNFMAFGSHSPEEDKALLQQQLTRLLYEQFYRFHTPKDEEDHCFLEELKKNNLSRNRIRKGYTLEITQEVPYTASRGSHRLKLEPGMYLLPGGKKTGDEAWVYFPKERVEETFYYAYSAAPVAFFHEAVLRFYFNTGIAGSLRLMNYLTGSLNRARVPFVIKCVYETRHIHRTDPFVLYTDYRFLGPVCALIRSLPDDVFPYPSVPLFTRVLRPGVGFAENPYDPELSFGMSRCTLLAEALMQPPAPGKDRLQILTDFLENRGYNIPHFFLNPGSRLIYPFL